MKTATSSKPCFAIRNLRSYNRFLHVLPIILFAVLALTRSLRAQEMLEQRPPDTPAVGTQSVPVQDTVSARIAAPVNPDTAGRGIGVDTLVPMYPMIVPRRSDEFIGTNFTGGGSPTKTLILDGTLSPLKCTGTKATKARWKLNLKMGTRDYTFDRTAFDVQCTVHVQEYDLSGGTTGTPLDIPMHISAGSTTIAPEQVYVQDFLSDYSTTSSVDKLIFTLNSVSLTPTGLTTNLSDSLRLVVSYELEFETTVNDHSVTPATPIDLVPQSLPGSNSTVTVSKVASGNPVTFKWSIPSCVDSLPNFEFQLLRLYNVDPTKLTSTNILAEVDWSQAMSIETGKSKPEITLSLMEGRGYYIWRVRPIGNEYWGGAADERNLGKWSATPTLTATPSLTSKSTLALPLSTADASVFFYEPDDEDKNWIYSRTFAEGDDSTTISEKITYATGLLQPVQSQIHVQSAENVVVSQTVLDYSGRNAVSSMSIPISGDAFTYRTGVMKAATSGGGYHVYTAADFDDNSNIYSPAPLDHGHAANYFSDANSDISIPNAEGYPFTRTVFYSDGRPREQSGFGFTHRITTATPPDAPRTTRVLYGTASDEELIRLFGDEAPLASTVHKVVTLDPNNVASVAFVSGEGTIATCLSKDTENSLVDALDESEEISGTIHQVVKYKDQIGTDQRVGENGMMITQRVVLSGNSTISMKYRLDRQFMSLTCPTYCASCDYIIRFDIRNAETDERVYTNTITLPAGDTCEAQTYPVSADLTMTAPSSGSFSPGTYIVSRYIYTNNPVPSTTDYTYDQYHADQAGAAVLALQTTSKTSSSGALKKVFDKLDEIKNGTATLEDLYALTVMTENENGDYEIDYGGCDPIVIPHLSCEDEAAPTSFEAYLINKQGVNTGFNDNLSLYFGWTKDASSAEIRRLPDVGHISAHGGGMFDRLIDNMAYDMASAMSGGASDPANIAKARAKLFKVWKPLVLTYKVVAFPNNTFNPDYNLLEMFLQMSGERKLVGYVNNEYGSNTGSTTSGTYGYFTHAHKYFKYTNGDCPVCENHPIAFTNSSGGTEYEFYNAQTFSSTSYSARRSTLEPSTDWNSSTHQNLYWDNFRRCVESCNRSMPDHTPEELDCIATQCTTYTTGCQECLAKYENKCKRACESKRSDLVKQLIDQYHARDYHVVGVEDPEMLSSEDPFTGSSSITLGEIDCQVDLLIDACQKNCSLTVSTDGDNHITQVGTTEELENIQKIFFYRMQAGLKTDGECPPQVNPSTIPWTSTSGSGSGRSRGEDLARWLTGKLHQFAMTGVGPEGGTFNIRATLRNFYSLDASLLFVGHDSLLTVGYKDISGRFEFCKQPCSEELKATESYCCKLVYLRDQYLGSPTSPHPLVNHLNRYLNIVWGFESGSLASSCTTYTYTGGYEAKNYCTLTGNSSNPAHSAILEEFDNDTLFGGINGDYAKLSGSSYQFIPRGSSTGDLCNGTWTNGRELGSFVKDRSYTTSEYGESYPVTFNHGTPEFLMNGINLTTPDDSYSEYSYDQVKVQARTFRDPPSVLSLSFSETSELIDIITTVRTAGTRQSASQFIYARNIGTSLDIPYCNINAGSIATFISVMSFDFTNILGYFGEDADHYLIYTDRLCHTTSRMFNIRFWQTEVKEFDMDCPGEDDGCPSLCYRFIPPPTINEEWTADLTPKSCEQTKGEEIRAKINSQLRDHVEKAKGLAKREYLKQCTLPESVPDFFEVGYEVHYYHFTLYYHDRAGRLVKTVPPAGVHLVGLPGAPGGMPSSLYRAGTPSHPNHELITKYVYNSLDQMVKKWTPDGNETRYWYDDLGRLRFAQNEEQRAPSTNKRYSYTLYDELGRVVESGEQIGNPSSFSQSNLNAAGTYPSTGTNWVRTFYSVTIVNNLALWRPGETIRQRFIRNRISFACTDKYDSTFYSYDAHGNVHWVRQELKGLGENYIRYRYDLYSGKMVQLFYNEGYTDQYFQRYRYDADNRLRMVESSRDGEIWDRDARYGYYAYGPLRRVDLGEDQLQGIDYTYTVQGWLKGINHPDLRTTAPSGALPDPGDDGDPGGSNKGIAPDAFGMMLNYYPGDFGRTGSALSSGSSVGVSATVAASPYYNANSSALYNGNIVGWVVNNTWSRYGGTSTSTFAQMTASQYRYDALNRLLKDSFMLWDAGLQTYAQATGSQYSSFYTYDPNGNIQTLNRYWKGTSPIMDSLMYHYDAGNANKLLYVKDVVGGGANPCWNGSYAGDQVDLADQQPYTTSMPASGANYDYDKIGNLILDKSEHTEIWWTPYGKVRRVDKYGGVNNVTPPTPPGGCTPPPTDPDKRQTIVYVYDAAGRRIKKIRLYREHVPGPEFPAPQNWKWHRDVTYYVYEAGGNVLAVYTEKCEHDIMYPETDTLKIEDAAESCDALTGDPPAALPSVMKLSEWMIYGDGGAGRLASVKPKGGITRYNRPMRSDETDDGVGSTELVPTTGFYTRVLEEKFYELKDHLGNVRVTITDVKLCDPTNSSTAGKAPFEAEVASYSNYYAFGMEQPDRKWYDAKGHYRYGFNGKENDDEVKGEGNELDYGERIYDPRVGRWLSIDKLADKYPDIAPYSMAVNSPIGAKDPDGRVVIFINGQHGGSGGTKAYWGAYADKVLGIIGDKSQRYVDGSSGGFLNTGSKTLTGAAIGFVLTPLLGPVGVAGGAVIGFFTSNISSDTRQNDGEKQGEHDAADIISNLKEGETIKIVTHSMGAAYARGYVKGIMAYANRNKLASKVVFEYELDVSPLQGAKLPVDLSLIKTAHTKVGGKDGGILPLFNSVLTVAPIPNARNTTAPADASKGHNIEEISTTDIPESSHNGAQRVVEEGCNNKNAP